MSAEGRTSAEPRPAGPHDWGLFGPGSATWKLHKNPALLAGGVRALIVQSFEPRTMAGVDQHSDYRTRPLERLKRTAEYVGTVVFGDTESAKAAADRVKRIHRRVRGTDPVTGTRYSAADVDSLVWIHCTEVHSFLAAHRAYGGRLTDEEQDRYLAEQVRAAELIGVPPGVTPDSRAAYREYFEGMRPKLCVSAASREAISMVTSPPWTRELAPVALPVRILASAGIAITPRYMREMAGLERNRIGYVTAGAVTWAAGRILQTRGLRLATAVAVGWRTVDVAMGALDAEARAA